MGTRVAPEVVVGATVVRGADVEVGDVEGPGDAALVWAGEVLSADEELAVLPHPAASMVANASTAIFRGVTASQLSAHPPHGNSQLQ